jgi:hypothetical protein
VPPEALTRLLRFLGRAPGGARRAGVEAEAEGKVGGGEFAEGGGRSEPGERVTVRHVHRRRPEPEVGCEVVQRARSPARGLLVQLDLCVGAVAEQHVVGAAVVADHQ